MPEPELLSCVEIDPEGAPDAAVIWLHGLGADGHDFAPIPPELGLPRGHGVRFVFPHAPRIPVTVNQGMIMPAWYDIRSLELRGQDEAGIRRSSRQLEDLIQRELDRGIASERIVVAGFSQGGAIALFTGLRYPRILAGVMALSTYLVLPDEVAAEATEANRRTPLFQAHGTYDPMVQLHLGRRTREWLEEGGWSVEWSEYPMAHQVCLEEIRAVGSWLTRVLDLRARSELG